MIQAIVNGVTITHDDERTMFREAMYLEEHFGMTGEQLNAGMAAGEKLASAVFIWFMVVRHRGDEAGISFLQAAAAYPFEEFDFDFNEVMRSLARLDADGNPIERPTRGPETSTSPDTSASEPPPTGSDACDSATSASSATTSTSSRGSGTASRSTKRKSSQSS